MDDVLTYQVCMIFFSKKVQQFTIPYHEGLPEFLRDGKIRDQPPEWLVVTLN